MALRPSTLFERLSAGAAPADPRAALRRSILRNLSDVLNARTGHAPAQMDLGTPPPCELITDYPACIPRLQAGIAACIGRYEPRLAAVRVTHVPRDDSLSLHFRIEAVLADGSRTPVAFSTHVDPTGRVSAE